MMKMLIVAIHLEVSSALVTTDTMGLEPCVVSVFLI